MRIYDNLSDLVGSTPLLRLNAFCKQHDIQATLLAKLEYFNPLGSVKDRVAKYMIEDALKKGVIDESSLIIEPTSGNTGIGLAFICAEKGLKLILTMPETMSMERQKLLRALGAELVLTEGSKGMAGAIEKAEELVQNHHGFMPSQFTNPANPEVHRKTTAVEIMQDSDSNIDAFVATAGTGGTITGIGQTLKAHIPDIKIFAAEAASSPVIEGGKPGPHKLQGSSPGFIAENFDVTLLDSVISVTDEEAYHTTRELAKTQGLLVGITSGAAVSAAAKLAKQEEWKDKTIVTLLPDTGSRYLSVEGLFDV